LSSRRFALSVIASLAIAGALMLSIIVFDTPNEVQVLRGQVTYHQNSSPRANQPFKTVWAELENKAAASFTVDSSKLLPEGQCVEFIRLERRFTKLNHYRFTRYC
jgi:hypothetical protein